MPPQKARYPQSNSSMQWFVAGYPGKTFSMIDKVVLHTTEGAWWPTYQGGRTAPNLTARPNMMTMSLEWRAHFPIGMAARALMNRPGGIETNTANVVQVELVGTCVSGGPGLHWPTAPDWVLRGLADFLTWMQKNWHVPFDAPELWLPYPSSYGNSHARMTPEQWKSFRGVCGHQHVPENDHGDPGDLPINRILKFAGKSSSREEDTVDAATISAIAREAAKEVWNRFLIPDENSPHPQREFREALGEILDNTQDILGAMNTQQAQIDALTKTVGTLSKP